MDEKSETPLKGTTQIPSSSLSNHSENSHLTTLITSHKLTEKNYLQWSQSMMMFISGRGRDDFLTGVAVQPKTDDPAYKAWRTENNLVMSWLINSMTTNIGENFLLYHTAKEIWDAARDTFSSNENTIELFHIESTLQDLRQGEQSVTVYYTNLTRYWQQLDLFQSYQWKCPDDSVTFQKITETKRIFKFLMGLNKTLDDVRGRILGIKPLPTLREVFSEVRREESRKRVMLTDSLPLVEVSALISTSDTLSESVAHTYHTYNNRPKGRPWCEHCKKPGHVKETCWKIHGKPLDWKANRNIDREARANTTTVATQSTPFTKEQIDALQQMIAATIQPSVATKNSSAGLHVSQPATHSPWIVDSGASDHMTGDRSLFSTYSQCKHYQTVRIADGSRTRVAGTGQIHISNSLILQSVLFVPSIDCNLISVSKLNDDLKCITTFHSTGAVFQDTSLGKTIGSAKLCSGIYLLNTKNTSGRQEKCDSPQCQSINKLESPHNKDSAIMMWHYRLGHPNFSYLKKLFPSLFINKNLQSFKCDICQFSKHTRSVYSPTPYKPSKPFSLIHGDIWGPNRIPNVTGARWFLLLIDDHTRLSWTYLMKEKSETIAIFKNFYAMIQTQFQMSIQVVKTDNAKEFFNTTLGSF